MKIQSLVAFVASLAAFTAVTPSPVRAQSQGQAPCAAPEHRQFDFWVGEWEVQNPQGQQVGTNSITRILGGCVLEENWSSARSAHAGTSHNIYDAAAGKWHQSWVDNAGLLLQLDGGFRGGKMVLEGERPGADGVTVLHRITWEQQGADRVRQLWQTSQDWGKTWTAAFDGLYIRR